MIRIGSQLTFCSPEKILRRSVVQLDEQNTVTGIYSLDDGTVETAQTLFYDGILSPEIVSLKQSISILEVSDQLKNYQYYDFSIIPPVIEILRTGKPLILDFNTSLPEKINLLLPYLTEALKAFSIFEIIAACTYYPSFIMGRQAGLTENSQNGLVLWENANLIGKKLLSNTQVRKMN